MRSRPASDQAAPSQRPSDVVEPECNGHWVSHRSVIWVLDEAERAPAPLVALLIGFARHADQYGRNSYPSIPRLVSYTRKKARQVQKDIALALTLGLIRKPVDQSAAAHIRSDRRPIVYDLGHAPLRAHEADPQAGLSPHGVHSTTRRTGHPVSTGRTPRRVVQDATGCTPGSSGVSHSAPEEDRTNQEDEETGGTLPPCPPATQADASADLDRSHDPLTAVPDLNDTKQVTSKTRTRANINRPLMTIVETETVEYPVDDYQLTLSVEIPPPPPDRYRDEILPALAEQLGRINHTSTTGATA